MADVLLFLSVVITSLSIIAGAYHFLCFEKYDSNKVQAFLRGDRPANSPIMIGHRGAMLDAPENTLTAFRVAAESGAFGVEFDVDFTKDGHAVIIHDATVDRTTDGQGKVNDYTLENIRKLNALGHFKESKEFTFTSIPTLEETIEICLDLGIKMFIEVKAYKDSVKAAQLLKELFQKYNLYEKAIVLSFYPNVIYQVRKADPSILVAQNWIKYHMSYNRDGTPKHSQWWMTMLTRTLDFIIEFSVHTWLSDLLRFPVLITHHSEASGQYINFWKAYNVSVLVYGVQNSHERDYFTHLGCPVIVDKVKELAS